MPQIMLASCAGATGQDDDEPLLIEALAELGLTAAAADWADPAADWAAADAVIVRSTWDYATRCGEFLDWARRVQALTRLHNPFDLLRWNTDKRYLRELQSAGVAVVATAWVDTAAELAAVWAQGSGDVVLKPAVSAGARDTARFGPADQVPAAEHAQRVLASGRTVMVQPYLQRLDTDGETGLVFLDGVYSHAFGKAALLAGEPPGPGLFAAETITARRATDAQRAVGEQLLAWVAGRFGAPPLYARVDLVPGEAGAQVIELELTEPSLNLAMSDGAAQRFALAIAARLG